LVAAETAVPLVAQVKRKGVAGLWDEMKTRVGDLKKDLISNLVSFLLPTIIIAGITWIVSLFNPASAFIRACKMIIDIIRFIVTNARQIIDFVNAVLDAVIAIARGGTGGVPALVERALARAIPVLIGALAALLGIGGIAGKIKGIFQKLSRPVSRAIDWVINKITGLIKKLWAKLKAALDRKKKPKKREKDKREKDEPRTDAAKQSAVRAAVRDVEALITPDTSREAVEKELPRIKRRHRLTDLRLLDRGPDAYYAHAVLNPTADGRDHSESNQVRVTRKDLKAKKPTRGGGVWEVRLVATTKLGEAEWGVGTVFYFDEFGEVIPDEDGPSMKLFKDRAKLPSGKVVSLKTDFSITEVALELVDKAYRAAFGEHPNVTQGNLERDNLKYFQVEYQKAKLAQPAAGRRTWAQIAIRAISFGRARVARGFRTFEVDVIDSGPVDLGEPYGVAVVPLAVRIIARR
jgi:hypothetical protein